VKQVLGKDCCECVFLKRELESVSVEENKIAWHLAIFFINLAFAMRSILSD
jgi:hypothetical protein